ncbi:MAG: nitronate monooxygenase [Alphaproteobacteria bacterium]|nr:nitronate monooxygenase [Alphaproteobacteria bacterium]
MWPRTDFVELLGITHPVIQAPMAGFASPALAAAVCNTGALGSIGCAGIPLATVREQITALRQATNRPYNLNFFVHSRPRLDPDGSARMRTTLASYFNEFGLGPVPEPKEPFPPFDEERLDLILELRPRVVSFHFGLPDATAVRRVKEAGCIILSSATTVAEARSLEANGADVIIAQGFEAGGHRGSFSGSPGAGNIGTMALVPQIADAVRLPVIAAGGIADGRGLAAAFALGASGVQLGTAFLGCPEATVSPLHRARLRSAADDGTELTRAFTGRPARALRNRYVTEMANSEPLEFPLQGSLVRPLWELPSEEARASFMPFWAGQGAPLIREIPASQLIDKLVVEAQSIFGRSA